MPAAASEVVHQLDDVPPRDVQPVLRIGEFGGSRVRHLPLRHPHPGRECRLCPTIGRDTVVTTAITGSRKWRCPTDGR